jgi:DNA (cytosine-5)-methyltransferase 1
VKWFMNYLNWTIAEYFAGIGLIRMGLEPYGWNVVFANDISAKKHAMYQGFFPDAPQHYVVKDIFEINPTSVPETLLATCSFPCTDLSLAGNMNGMNGEHSSAFWGFVRILQAQAASAPPFVLVENVTGWLYSNGGADFRITVQALNQLGYACDVFTLDALSFTPQSRPRIFLIGTKMPLFEQDIDPILERPRSLLSDHLKKSILSNPDLRWSYNEIPAPPFKLTKGLGKIVEDMDEDDPRWWSQDEVNRHLKMMKETHLQRVLKLASNEQLAYRTFFRRIREGQQRAEVRDDDLAGCLRTAVGGSGKQFLIQAGQGRILMRTMTPREYARLQGVPDKYPIAAEGVQAFTGFGDAVCVPVLSWIAQHILNPLVENYFAVESILR